MPNTKKRGSNSKGNKIMSPIDINVPANIKKMNGVKERIEAGPLTLVFVYAKWCGHCHEFKPYLDNAMRSKKRSVQVVNVDEEHLNKVNEYLKNEINENASINVEGYPSLLLIDKKGNNVASVQAVRDSAVLENVLNNAGKVVSESTNKTPSISKINEQLPEIFSTPHVAEEPSIAPMEEVTEEQPQGAQQKGGRLLEILTKTSYQLAPTAILLGLASQQFKRNRTNKRKMKRRRTTYKRKI